MDPREFRDPSGSLVDTILGQKAFVPFPLPPRFDLSSSQQILSEADQKLGELRGIGRYLPTPYLLIRPLQQKEAIASSNIEGTYTSLPELLVFEAAHEERQGSSETREVFNYIRALRQGMDRLAELPISTRLIHELHKTLLMGLPRNRSGHAEPGEYRRDQNFIGKSREIAKSRFNPPPPPTHIECVSDLEKFINSDASPNIAPLVFLALVHYQFETIHPFPDGNGRVGRLLIPLILKSKGIMEQPLLYMSQYFEDNKDEYVELMLKVSQESRWGEWIAFFLKGVVRSCETTIDTIRKVRDLEESYRARCQQARSSALLLKIVDLICERIAITVPDVEKATNTSYTAAQNNVRKLVEYGILKHLPGPFERPKYYFATELMDIFET